MNLGKRIRLGMHRINTGQSRRDSAGVPAVCVLISGQRKAGSAQHGGTGKEGLQMGPGQESVGPWVPMTDINSCEVEVLTGSDFNKRRK